MAGMQGNGRLVVDRAPMLQEVGVRAQVTRDGDSGKRRGRDAMMPPRGAASDDSPALGLGESGPGGAELGPRGADSPLAW